MSDVGEPTFEDGRLGLGADPIPGDAPAGTSVRSDALFETLEEDIRKLETDGPTAVHWPSVVTRGQEIIGQRSKDLLVGVWLTHGLFSTEGLRGLAVGLSALRDMCEAHWAGMQPPAARERARVAAVEWLAGRIAPVLGTDPPAEADWPVAIHAYDAADGLDRALSERLTKEQASLGELIRALRPLRDEARRGLAERARLAAEAAAAAEAQKLAAEQVLAAASEVPAGQPVATIAPAAVSPATMTPAVTEASAPAAGLAAGGDLDVVLAQFPEAMRGLAERIRQRDPLDARGAVLNRTASWWRIRQLPPNQDGRTGAAPPVEEIALADGHRQAGRHLDAFHLLETMVWTAPFWLDGHRLAAAALAGLGGASSDAQAAIKGMLAGFSGRWPDLLRFTFADGRPFADDETRAWLGSGGGSQAAADPIQTLAAEARRMVAAGRAADAIDSLVAEGRGARGRDRARVQLAQAQFCLDAGLVAAALPLLEHLDLEADRRDLEEWEPDFALKIAEARFRALTHADAPRLVPDERRRAALDATRARLARLDLAVAARLFRTS